MKDRAGIIKTILFISVVLIIAVTAGQANAAVLFFGLDMEYTGGTPPSVPGPWVTAKFIDVGPNSVQLTMSTDNLTGQENVKGWHFNFDDSLDLSFLEFSPYPGSKPGDATNLAVVESITLYKDRNNLNAGGGGRYDFMFAFANSGNKFTSGKTVVYNLTYTGNVTMNVGSFNFLDNSNGGHGPFYSAAHIQRTGNNANDSGWIANETSTISYPIIVPEPISSTLFLVGGAAMGLRRFRKTIAN